MDIEAFLTEALVQIQHGVQGAIEKFKEGPYRGGHISPAFEKDGKVDWPTYRQTVEFDLAVTVSDKRTRGGKAGVGISIAGFDVKGGGDLSQTRENSTVNRIKFTISILPAVDVIKVD